MPAQLSRIHRLHHELLPNTGGIVVSGTYQMHPGDHLVKFGVATAYTITLPPVADCNGSIYVLRAVGAGASTVTVVDKGDSLVAVSDTLNAANEAMIVYSDGEMWHFLVTPPA